MVTGADGAVPTARVGDAGRLTGGERRDMLLDMAARLAVAESPEGVTMDLVAERCGVSRPLVYKHFANREEMLEAVYRRQAERLHAELTADISAATSVEEAFRALVRGALRAADEWSHFFAALRGAGAWGGDLRREQRQRDERTMRAFARRAIEELGIDTRTGPTAVSLLLSMMDPVLSEWRRDPTPARAALLEETYMTVVTATLRHLAPEPPERV